MKLLVFAHAPPPYHGQSIAVQLMLNRFGGDRRRTAFRLQPPNQYGIECYHVNARFSKTLEDVGELQFGKILFVLFYCLQAIWCHFRYGVNVLYYVPAPGKGVALYRDWLVMFLCRPFFQKVIFHWHGGGLAKWLETVGVSGTRSLTYRLMGEADLSVVLTEFGRRDAEKLMPRRLAVIASGIADPCPQFAETLLPRRRARAAALKAIILSGNTGSSGPPETVVRVFFVATCSREKGLFDAIEGLRLANEKAATRNLPLRFHLTVAGAFASAAEEKELHELIRRNKLQEAVVFAGFVSDERKYRELCEADIFCFPTYYAAEGQPASVAEALAFGLPVITTRWRAVPAMLPENYPGLVDIKSPGQIAEKLFLLCDSDLSGTLREVFLSRFTVERHLANLSETMRGLEHDEKQSCQGSKNS